MQCYGAAATDFLRTLIDGKEVRLVADTQSTNTDKFDRLLRYVFLRDGTDVNAEIIKQGYGFAFVGFPLSRLDEFQGYETLARLENRGLWDECDPIYEDGHYESNDAASVEYIPSMQLHGRMWL